MNKSRGARNSDEALPVRTALGPVLAGENSKVALRAAGIDRGRWMSESRASLHEGCSEARREPQVRANPCG